jgi:hypothetical protein
MEKFNVTYGDDGKTIVIEAEKFSDVVKIVNAEAKKRKTSVTIE